jgi:hypothetical protein
MLECGGLRQDTRNRVTSQTDFRNTSSLRHRMGPLTSLLLDSEAIVSRRVVHQAPSTHHLNEFEALLSLGRIG